MKKICPLLIAFFLVFTALTPHRAWAGCVPVVTWIQSACVKMTEDKAKELARQAIAIQDPSIISTGTPSIQGLAHYNDPTMAGCRNCQDGAQMINDAYQKAYSAFCKKTYTEEADITDCTKRHSGQVENNIKKTAHGVVLASANSKASIYCMGAQAAATLFPGFLNSEVGALQSARQGWNNGQSLVGKIGQAAWGSLTGRIKGMWEGMTDPEAAKQNILNAVANAGSSTYNKVSGAFYSFHDGCWFCPIFDTVYDVANNLATSIYTNLRGHFLSFLMILAFGWILFHVLKFFITLHGPNVGEFLTTFFKTMGAVMLAALFLTPDVTFLTGYLIDVPAHFAIGLSDEILATSGFSKDGCVVRREYSVARNSDCPDSDLTLSVNESKMDLCQPSASGKYQNMAMSQALHDNFSCMIKKISYELVDYIAIAATIIVESFSAGWLGLPSLSLLIVGVLMLLCYFYFYIKIPFYLIDLILRLCFLIIMLPIFVVCYPFPSTRGYSKKGWEMLLSILVHLISLCIFISLALMLVMSVIPNVSGSSQC